MKREAHAVRGRAAAETLLRELGGAARLVVYIAAAPGAGKTRRLLREARSLREAGKNAMIGSIETKERPDLDFLSASIPRVPPREVPLEGHVFQEFDFNAALVARPDALILDELAHENLPGSVNAKRWEDALALRDHGISVYGAFNIAHLETVAVTAGALTGFPARERVPLSFLNAADEVIALDVPIALLQHRLRSGKIVRQEDVDRALSGIFQESTLLMLRELMLRTIDQLTIPGVSGEQTSVAAVYAFPGIQSGDYIKRAAAVAAALDLSVEVRFLPKSRSEALETTACSLNAETFDDATDFKNIDLSTVRASLIAIPAGKAAVNLASRSLDRDLLIVDSGQSYVGEHGLGTPYAGTAGDRLRIGYGKLTVYLGAAAGSGKTYAMLDRAHQLESDGIDVVAAFIESHGRKETEELLGGLEVLPRKALVSNGLQCTELDVDAVLTRKPTVALIDELAHTNAPASAAPKRYEDVLAILRAGIDVITTLNVQHLEALGDAVFRLTGTTVRETLPDGILGLADEVVLIDVSPETLRERLRQGKIYPKERIDAALKNFFRTDNLLALRELAVRETLRAEHRERVAAPFDRLLLGVTNRPQDVSLIKRCSHIAARLETEFAVAHIFTGETESPLTQRLESEARRVNAQWLKAKSSAIAATLLQLSRAQPETMTAVGGTLRKPAWFARSTFARQVLDAGARELFVLAPSSNNERD